MKSVAILLLAVLVAGIPGGAGATGVKITVNSGGDIPPGPPPPQRRRGLAGLLKRR